MSIISKGLKYIGTSSKAKKAVKKTVSKTKAKSVTVVGAPNKRPYRNLEDEQDAAAAYKIAKKAHSVAKSNASSKLTGLAKQVALKNASPKKGASASFKKAKEAVAGKITPPTKATKYVTTAERDRKVAGLVKIYDEGKAAGKAQQKAKTVKKVVGATVAAGTAGYIAGKSQGKKK